MKHLTNIDLNQNEVQNFAIQKLATAPATPVKGQVYFNTTSNRAFVYNGTSWVSMDSIDATMTGVDIVTAINGSAGVIDLDNLAASVVGAVTNSHTHSNKTVLDNTTASFTTADETKLDGIEAGAEVNNISDANALDLTDAGDSTLHYHAADRARANHTGTQSADTIIDGTTNKAYTATEKTKLSGIETGAQVNVVTSVAGKTGTVLLAKGDVGLGNVTNDAQVKKLASSTSGKIPTWNGTTGDALNDGYTVETTLSGASTAIPRADAVKTYVDALLSANDAMVYKGTLGSGGTITVLPTTHSAGWAYKVITAGTYAGVVCEVGDLIIAVIDRAGSGNLNSDWTVVQTNTDGAVIGPASATDGNIVLFNGTTGKLVKNSTYGPSSFAAAGHNHDGTYLKKYEANVGDGVATSIVVTHNLNTQDVVVMLREVASPYAVVMTDIEITSVNTITLKFATAPTSGQYRVVVTG